MYKGRLCLLNIGVLTYRCEKRMNQIQQSNDKLFQQIADLIELSRKRVKTAIDTTMVYTYYHV